MIDAIKLVLVFGLAFWGIKSCTDSEWYENSQKERIAREQAAATPHVIREADGCKVYAFFSGGRDHYFTRCPDSKTTTESSYTVNCGKNCNRTEVESIEVTK